MLARPRNYTQLQPEDRVALASLQQQSYSIRAMARLHWSPEQIALALARLYPQGP